MTFFASIRSRPLESKNSAGGVPADPGGHALGLNPQQAAAVLLDHESDGPALVLAGAGSGKTTVLARRIARQALLDGGGEGILALTFTRDAAGEMEERVKGLLGRAAPVPAPGGVPDGTPASFRQPRFGTFHSFAFGLIRATALDVPNWRRLGFRQCPSLLEPAARSAWLAGSGEDMGLEAPPELLEKWAARPFEAAGDAMADRKGGAEGGVDGAARELRNRFRRRLLDAGSVAFDDMVALAIRLLRDHPEALDETRARTRRVLVDEFQDTSPDQLELIRLILGGRPSLFLVGDDDQAIYGFRGADPGNIGRALELFPGLSILKLETNYRSTPPIVEYANAVFSGKPPRLRKVLRAGRPLPEGVRPAPVRVLAHPSGVEQGVWMAGEMRRLIREEGLAWGDMAILYRVNALGDYYRSMLASLAGPEAASRVVLATVHASKGLQYPAVFLVGLEDGVLPYRRKGEDLDPGRMAEERRIFYVGVTRAERHLYLCSCGRRMVRGRMREQRPSPFLREGRGRAGGAGRDRAGDAGAGRGGWLGMGRRMLRLLGARGGPAPGAAGETGRKKGMP